MNVSTVLKIPRTMRNASRIREISAVLARQGFGGLLDRMGLDGLVGQASEGAERLSIEARVRVCLEQLGPTFVKLGQMLATRPDLIPMSLVAELRKLHDDVPPVPKERVLEVIEEEHGQPATEIFARFDEEPLAAASIGQVHRAQLADGTEVVVKVQRPDLQRVIDRDLEILRALANLIDEKIPESRQFSLPLIVDEFAGALRQEVDFNNERHNMERFNTLWADDDRVAAPRAESALCTRRTLVMELVEGAKVTDVEAVRAIGGDPLEVARLGTHIALKSIFEHGFFHADPHPGNFFVLPGGRITLIDFGMMGVIDERRIGELLTFLVAIVLEDPEMMVRLFAEMDLLEGDTDERALERDIKALLDRYKAVPIGEIDLGRFIGQVFEAVVSHGVRLPGDLLLVGKSLTTMEGIAQEIAPEFDPIAEMKPYLLKRYGARMLDPTRQARELSRVAGDTLLLLRTLPRELRTVVRKLRKGELRVVTADEHAVEGRKRADRRANRALVLGLSVSASALATVMLLAGHGAAAVALYIMGGVWLLWGLWGVLRSGGV